MLFNSFEFLVFFISFFILYWNIKKVKYQNLLIVVGSLLFYGWWDYRFLFLLLFSFTVDYIIGIKVYENQNHKIRRLLLFLSLLINLSLLGVFKYYNFFVDSLQDLLVSIGFNSSSLSLNIILPVGISFYTFQTLSYTIDIYNNKLKPTKDPIAFLAFISFFPQLVAGPIERAVNLLPQFFNKRKFSYSLAKDGIMQIIWGFFKKVVIADNISKIVTICFTNYLTLDSFTLLIGVIFFAVQIYCDFSGYSDMALGIARLLGFDLMTNFSYPYFSRDISEFWRRWHISLSTWFRDYVYIPLGGSRGGLFLKIRNVLIIFLVSGLWHGANWTFIFWGAINAIFFLPLILSGNNRNNLGIVANGKLIPTFKDILNMLFTFSIVCFGWIFFRAESISEAFVYIEQLFQFTYPEQFNYLWYNILNFTPFIIILFAFEWARRTKTHPLSTLGLTCTPVWIKISSIIFIIIIIVFGNYGGKEFIYFQF